MPDATDLLPSALWYHQAGDLGRAERLCLELLDGQPDHPDALFCLAWYARERTGSRRQSSTLGMWSE